MTARLRAAASVVSQNDPADNAPHSIADDIETIVSAWRAEQATGRGCGPEVRFVLNFGLPVDDAALGTRIGTALGLAVDVGPLFGPDLELDRFRRVVIPGTSR